MSNLRNEKRAGQITKDEYKQSKLDIKQKYEKALLEDVQNIVNSRKNITPDTSRKISEIYSKYKDTAYKEIPNYLIHKGIRFGAKVGASVLVGMAVNSVIKNVAKPFVKGYGSQYKELLDLGYSKSKAKELLFTGHATYHGNLMKGALHPLKNVAIEFTKEGSNNIAKAVGVAVLDSSAAGITGAVALNATAKKVSKHTV